MESRNVNHDEDKTGERHSSTLEGRFNEMKAANKAQNASFSEFFRRMEQQFLDLKVAFRTIISQKSETEKRNR